jgi:hypothetical protein
VNEIESKKQNFEIAKSEHEFKPMLENLINAWETQRYTDGHFLLTV